MADNMRAFRNIVEAWQRGDLSVVDALVAPDYLGHVSSGDRDRDGLKARIGEFNATFPGVRFLIEDQFASGDKVVTRMIARAGDVRLMGINVSRFSNGILQEEWATWERITA